MSDVAFIAVTLTSVTLLTMKIDGNRSQNNHVTLALLHLQHSLGQIRLLGRDKLRGPQ